MNIKQLTEGVISYVKVAIGWKQLITILNRLFNIERAPCSATHANFDRSNLSSILSQLRMRRYWANRPIRVGSAGWRILYMSKLDNNLDVIEHREERVCI